jgi:hypothetical protein
VLERWSRAFDRSESTQSQAFITPQWFLRGRLAPCLRRDPRGREQCAFGKGESKIIARFFSLKGSGPRLQKASKSGPPPWRTTEEKSKTAPEKTTRVRHPIPAITKCAPAGEAGKNEAQATSGECADTGFNSVEPRRGGGVRPPHRGTAWIFADPACKGRRRGPYNFYEVLTNWLTLRRLAYVHPAK